MPDKPMGRKLYGSIPHLPGSRLGTGDHHVPEGQARICCERTRDDRDRVIVQPKYDGSCVGVWKPDDSTVIPLTRAGYRCTDSIYEQHHLFHDWAMERAGSFLAVLEPGERLVGEWLAQAHGTRYDINCLFGPFIAFDIMRDDTRLPFFEFAERLVCGASRLPEETFHNAIPLHYGPIQPAEAMKLQSGLFHLGGDTPEGLVYRVERDGRVELLAKYVDHGKVDGKYLVKGDPVWNWPSCNRPASDRRSVT